MGSCVATIAGAAVTCVGVAAAALYLLIDEQNSPKEISTAAEQRNGDSIDAGAFETCKLTDGVTCYRRYGWAENPEAPVVVLIHGGTIPSPVFAPLAKAGVQDGLRVLTYDQYGKGYSDRLAKDCRFGMPVYSRQLRQLLDHLGLTLENNVQVVLLGLSFGGAILAHFAAEYPGRVAGVVAGCPMVQHLGPNLSKLRRLVFLVPSRKWPAFIFRKLALPKMAKRVAAMANDNSARFTASTLGAHMAFAGRLMLAQFQVKGTEENFLKMFSSTDMPGPQAGGDLLWAAWAKIAQSDLPVEFLYATDDQDIPVADSERLAALLAGRAAPTNIYSTTGGHGFFIQPTHVVYTLGRIGKMLRGDNYQCKIDGLNISGGSAGL